ncbi:unnamed protein product [Rotaria socialis]|uniref:Uncharacterized protein n=1 Tax=Rotaria socialis TaxID=392032 RepID=A0A821E192_9BILA|nr:unnamed protein product [Rotaria socialis]
MSRAVHKTGGRCIIRNDGESESRVTVSRSASAVAKVVTSKSDTIKSTTSSSTPSSRENPTVLSSATVTRSKSLVSIS